jgi:riboflavin synthase
MFTGLVEALGTVSALHDTGAGRRLIIRHPELAPQLALGESVSVNGACLTVVEPAKETFSFDVGPETLLRTNLGALSAGERVNLERAMLASSRLGGHLVQGHVDGVGMVVEKREEVEWVFMAFSSPGELLAQMVPKGSICVDGVSLTLVEVAADRFSVMLIPHTLANTTLGFKGVGSAVNLETDMLAKYVFKALEHYRGRLP